MLRVVQNNSGSTLIEVLVALSLFTTVLLSVSIVSLKGLGVSREALYHTRALMFLEALHEGMLAASFSSEAPFSVPEADLLDWQKSIQQNLPDGRGALMLTEHSANIVVSWYSPHYHNQQKAQLAVSNHFYAPH